MEKGQCRSQFTEGKSPTDMIYVVDASVGVSAAKSGEPAHDESVEFFRKILKNRNKLLLPPMFQIEITATLARLGAALSDIRRILEPLLSPPSHVITIGPLAARRIERTAIRLRLRGADAIYAWLAERENVPLVTLDGEHLHRVPL